MIEISEDIKSLSAKVLDTARTKGIMITTAESCTGGMISMALTDIPGSSDVVDRAIVAYSYEAKSEWLNVNWALMNEKGAVSQHVVEQMARGALANSKSDVAVAVTGVAGPGASQDKPEGMVWFGVATAAGVRSELKEFGALGRANVRNETCLHALQMLLVTIEAV